MRKIPIEDIKKFNHLVTHANCMDGLGTAIVLRQINPDIKISFVYHDSKEINAIEPKEGIVFCDITPPEDKINAFKDAKTYVLDHHKSVKHVVEKFEDLGFYGDEKLNPGISGTVLAYNHIFKSYHENQNAEFYNQFDIKNLQIFAKLVGIRDTWYKDSELWEQANKQHLLMAFYPFESWIPENSPSFYPPYLPNLEIQDILASKKEYSIKDIISKSKTITVKNKKFVILAGNGHYISDICDLLDCDAVFGVSYSFKDKPILNVSSRSRGRFDLSKLAESMGGGGHTNAAGFSLAVKENDLNPYMVIQNILEEYHEKQIN